MALESGTTLGPYEIVSSLGAGGMGEVYRARDPKLGREVAIKLLLEEVSADAERLARFEREARVLAGLNHPNIATLYGLEEADGAPFLVMELVEGETLADRLARGPLPVADAVPLFVEIAEGLAAAHAQGVVHRDLKPANVKIRPDGGVKILDFGLAKAAFGDAGGDDPVLSDSPTMPLEATRHGQILGTAAYMSPEQAKGEPLDARTDIWAFGACLWEALTGERLFRADGVTETLAFVLTQRLDWDRLPPALPDPLRRLLHHCLERDPRLRLQHVGDARLALRDALEANTEGTVAAAHPVGASATRARTAAWAAAAATLAALAVWALKPAPPAEERQVLRSIVTSPGAELLTERPAASLAITPDGSHILYSARPASREARVPTTQVFNHFTLYQRPVDSLEGRRLGELNQVYSTVVSPDSEWVLYNDFGDDTLKRMALLGGSPEVVCELPGPGVAMGLSWGADDTIVFAAYNLDGLQRVSADGGEPEALTVPSSAGGETAHVHPEILPGGRGVVFTIDREAGFELAVLDLETAAVTPLRLAGSSPRYAATGHLVYGHETDLWAVPFDLESLSLRGTPVRVVQGVVTKYNGAVDFSFSRDGRLVYAPGGFQGAAARRLVWVDRAGRQTPIASDPLPYHYPSLSPDGSRLAVGVLGTNRRSNLAGPFRLSQIYLLEVAAETLQQFTFDGALVPVWWPDSRSILFDSLQDGAPVVHRKAVSGAGPLETVASGPPTLFPRSVGPDGKRLVLVTPSNAAGGGNIYLQDPTRGEDFYPLVATEASELNPQISPDGRWLLYQSDESTTMQIWVRPFPDVESGGPWRVSSGIGFHPRWSPDGDEIFFRSSEGLMATRVQTEGEFRVLSIELLFDDSAFYSSPPGETYDVHPDGRFLMITAEDAAAAAREVVMVENWFEELERLVPTG
jgi:serine/threonine-protein kinase